MKTLLVLVLVVLFQADVPGAARFEISSGAPLVGEPVTLTLRVAMPDDAIIVEWPRFPTDWPPFEVVEVGELVIEAQEGQTLYSQQVEAVIWLPGDYETLAATVQYRLAGEEEVREVVAEPVFVTVPSVLELDDTQLRPLKAQRVMPYLSPLLVFGIVSLIAVLIGAGSWYAHQRYQRQRPASAPPVLSPESAVLADLQLFGADLIAPEVVYMRVSDRLRQYMGERYGFPAEDMTSDEIMVQMRSNPAARQQQTLERLLYQADMVKFARQVPTRRHAEQYVKTAAQWVRSVAMHEADT